MDELTTYITCLRSQAQVHGIAGRRAFVMPDSKGNGQLNMSHYVVASYSDTACGRLYWCTCTESQGARIQAVLSANAPTAEFCAAEKQLYCIHCRALVECAAEHSIDPGDVEDVGRQESGKVDLLQVSPLTASVCTNVRQLSAAVYFVFFFCYQ